MRLSIILILGFWISFFKAPVSAQESAPIAVFAEKAYTEGNFDLALKEFLRAHFMGEKSPSIPISKRVSDLFVWKKDYQLAIQYLDYYYFENKGDVTLQGQITLDKVKIHLLQNDTKAALYEVFQVNTRRFPDKDRLTFYTALALMADHQIVEGFKYIKKLSYIDPKDYIALDALEKKMVKNDARNPNNARWWSILVPGLAQVIYGDPADGLTSFALLAGLSYVMIDVGLTLSWPDALLSVGPWWGRYYIGGVGNAVDQATRHKEEKGKLLMADLLDLLAAQKNL